MRAGHALVRRPRNLRVKGGTANVVACECGAMAMQPTLVGRIAWHAEHVAQLPPPAEVRHRAVRENQRLLAELTERLAGVSGD